MGFPGGSAVNNLLANTGDAEDRFSPWGWEDLLEEEMATHSNIVAQKITWTEEPSGYSSWGCRELDTTEQPSKHDVNM